MNLDVVTTGLVVIAGFGSGVLASVLGVGGAVITTPFIRFLGATPIAAIGSTVPAILPGAISGSIRYQREDYISWRTSVVCGGFGMMSAVLGGWVADVVNAQWLMVATALLVMWSGASLIRDARRDHGENAVRDATTLITLSGDALRGWRPRGGTFAVAALGVLAGFLAGLLGIGGGLVLTPGLSLGLRLPMKNAVATSLSAVAMMSTTALATHISLGHIDWRFALPLAVGVVPGARMGSRITVQASERRLREVAGILLVVIASIYLATEMSVLF